MVARFIGGLGIGGSSVLGPVYIAELAPAKWRGRMVGLFQINIVVGILLAYLSNYIITTRNLGPLQWRWEQVCRPDSYGELDCRNVKTYYRPEICN